MKLESQIIFLLPVLILDQMTDVFYLFISDPCLNVLSISLHLSVTCQIGLFFILKSLINSLRYSFFLIFQRWEPVSMQQRHGSSIVEVYRIVEEVPSTFIMRTLLIFMMLKLSQKQFGLL